MNINEYMNAKNKEYKSAMQFPGMDDAEFNRSALIGLDGISCSEQELTDFIQAVLNITNTKRTLAQLQSPLQDTYLLAIGYNGSHAQVKPLYDVWMNLKTNCINVRKPYNPFCESDYCIKISDYRTIDKAITWRDCAFQEDSYSE